MKYIGIIGGSGLTKLAGLEIERQQLVMTPFGEPSGPLTFGAFAGKQIIFLPRHGAGNRIPPHQINYRANIWALHHVGVEEVIGVASVGGITQPPESICIPDQLIDYTWGREHTFHTLDQGAVSHIEFTEPYCPDLRKKLMQAASDAAIGAAGTGCYGATQGPRLETAMEIQRMKGDGCDLVGMTGMPEAALAREIGLCYASCSVVVNWAAGIKEGPITMEEIEEHTVVGMERFERLLSAL
ncbi:MAG: S-methyl-5'-thioinosine phosphorylase [bacterium]